MMGPDSASLGISPLGSNFFETLLEKGVDYLQTKAAAYTAPKSNVQTAMYAPAAPIIVTRNVAVGVPVPMKSEGFLGMPTWAAIAAGVGLAALVVGGAVWLGKR